MRGREDNDITNPQQPRVWRLFLERGGWIYLFRALPSNAKPGEIPSMLAIQESEKGHIIIRSPEASKTSSP
ncbi:MAG: hypothetical protein V7L29_20750 [Nostoc sp.]|uniref:hypothetical protein n=1 Tax=Nostoc sp. TaxID=1180 RepID=UPI002FFA7DE3